MISSICMGALNQLILFVFLAQIISPLVFKFKSCIIITLNIVTITFLSFLEYSPRYFTALITRVSPNYY